MKTKRIISFLFLIMIILIPFNVEAKDYKIMLTFLSDGGTVASGNVEINGGVVFVKNTTKTEIVYNSSQTIKHINSLDGNTTFTLKNGNNSQTKTKEWYSTNYSTSKKVYFDNSKSYTVKEIAKMLDIDTSKITKTQEITLTANYKKVVPVESIAITTKKIIIGEDKESTLSIEIQPKKATNKNVTWKSSNEKIVTVTSKGRIKGIKAGKAIITVTTEDGKKTSNCKVEVKKTTSQAKPNKNVKSPRVTIKYYTNGGTLGKKHGKEISVSDGKILKDKKDEYQTILYNAKEDLANYDNEEAMNIVKKGYRAIEDKEWNTKKNGKGKSYSQSKEYKGTDFCNDTTKDCTVKLYLNWEKSPVQDIKINPEDNISVKVGETTNISVNVVGQSKLKWTISKPEIAKVTTSGKITGLNEGKTKITVTAKEDKNVSKSITVNVKKNSSEDIDEARTGYVYFLDTRHGDVAEDNESLESKSDIILINSNGKYGLIDTGFKTDCKDNPSIGVDGIVKRLKKLGVDKLDFLKITHAHVDHTACYKEVFDNFKIKTLYIKKDGMTQGVHQEKYKAIVSKAENSGTEVCDVKKSSCQQFYLGYISFKLYNTKYHDPRKYVKGTSEKKQKSRRKFENLNSIATVANINGRRVYFAGDLGNNANENIEEKTAEKVGDIDIYKTAHHGLSALNNSKKTIKILKPEYSITTFKSNDKTDITTDRMNNLSKGFNKKNAYFTANGLVKLTIDSKGNINFQQ